MNDYNPDKNDRSHATKTYFSKASVAKAYLYDVQTKLYVATDSMQHMQHYSVHMEICSGMIEMVYRSVENFTDISSSRKISNRTYIQLF